MEHVTLPNSDLKVSNVCIGTWQFNASEMTRDKTWQGQSIEESKAIVDKAIELGVNFFDTAEGYRNSEETLGKILEGRRKDVVIASKFGTRVKDFSGTDVEVSLLQSLEKLKTDYIDLYQIHWPSMLEQNKTKEIIDELKRLQAKGLIKSYGVCNYGKENMEELVDAGAKFSTNQLSYSLLWRPIEDEILPMCEKLDVGVLAYSPLQQGLLSGNYLKLEDVPEGRRRTRLFNSTSTELSKHRSDGAEPQMFEAIAKLKAMCEKKNLNMPAASLSWVLQRSPVKCVIVGASSPEQVVKNVQLAKLDQAIVQEMNDITDTLKCGFGNNADLWAPEARMK